MKILSVAAEFSHMDRQAEEHDEANSRLSQICESV